MAQGLPFAGQMRPIRLLTSLSRPLLFLAIALFSYSYGCGQGGSDGGGSTPTGPPPPLAESRAFRAIAGVSMGGYGALNLGTKHARSLRHDRRRSAAPSTCSSSCATASTDNLEVKAQTEIPREVGEDFTFDHLPPYPDRDSRIESAAGSGDRVRQPVPPPSRSGARSIWRRDSRAGAAAARRPVRRLHADRRPARLPRRRRRATRTACARPTRRRPSRSTCCCAARGSAADARRRRRAVSWSATASSST